jgi:predicted negative regulator of RcsB-dependent stress response
MMRPRQQESFVEYTTEEQQVEAIKNWWKENAKSVIGGILIGLAVLFGGRAYLHQQDQHVANASMVFEGMMQNMAQNQPKQAAEKGAQLLGEYSDTPYAVMASLSMAKIKADEGDLTTAKLHLRYALDNAKKDEIKHVARLRLARVLLAEGNNDEALKLLDSADPGTFAASYQELKGDIYVAKGDIENARSAYTLALAAMGPGDRGRNNLQMKLDDLGGAASPAGVS